MQALTSKFKGLFADKQRMVVKFFFVFLVIAFGEYLTLPDDLVRKGGDVFGHEVPVGKSDFIIFYDAARIAYDNSLPNFYDLMRLNDMQEQTIGYREKYSTPYLYPPYSMLFFGPLASFSLQQAYHIWHLCNAAFTFLLIVALYYAGICRSLGALAVAAFFMVSSYPWIGAMANGQPVIIMALGLLGGQLLVRYKHYWLAAVLLIVTAFKPPLVIAPILYLLIISGRPLWKSMMVVGVAVVAVCAAVFDVSIWRDYVELLIKTPDMMGVDYAVLSMVNVRTLALLLWGENHISAINIMSNILWVAMMMVVIGIAWCVRYKDLAIQNLGFGFVIGLSCIFSPYLYANSLFLLIIPIAYAIKYGKKKQRYSILTAFTFVNYLAANIQPEWNFMLWVPAQLALMIFLFYRMRLSRHSVF